MPSKLLHLMSAAKPFRQHFGTYQRIIQKTRSKTRSPLSFCKSGFPVCISTSVADLRTHLKGKATQNVSAYSIPHVTQSLNSIPAEISDTTFAWMVECIRPYLAFDETTINQSMIEYSKLLEDIRYRNKKQQPGMLDWLYNEIYNYVPFLGSAPSHVAPDGFGWGKASFNDSYQGLMAWSGDKPRKPKQCETEVVVSAEKIETVKLEELGETNEFIHPVVRFRRLANGKEKGALYEWDWREHTERKRERRKVSSRIKVTSWFRSTRSQRRFGKERAVSPMSSD
jgi:hypothetical protein